MAIDTHAHVFKRDLALAGDRRYAPTYDATIADYLAMLDRNGMSHGVLIQPSFLGTDNSYLVEALRTAPERLRGIVVVAPEIGRRELEALAAEGCVGVRLNLIGQPDPAFETAIWKTHLADLAALGWQVEVQAEARRLPTLLPALVAGGVPWSWIISAVQTRISASMIPDSAISWAPARAAGFGSSYPAPIAMATTGLVSHAVAAAALLREALGPDRLVWGSDWPHTRFEAVASPAAARHSLDAWIPDRSERHTVLVETPAHLFGFRTGPNAKP